MFSSICGTWSYKISCMNDISQTQNIHMHIQLLEPEQKKYPFIFFLIWNHYPSAEL